jgi:PST family polysaccharide transporter
MNKESNSIAGSAISGIRWNYFGGISASLCSIAIGIVLARILGPRPFGQVIIASTIYGFLNLFVDGGFSQALIQKRTLTAVDIRKTFTCQIAIGVCTTGLVYLLAPWIAQQFRDPSAVQVVRAMSLMIAIQSTGLVSAALLRRAMRFKVIQYAALASYLFGYLIVGIPLALHGAGVWSLVLAYLSQCLLNSLLLHTAARPSLRPLFALPDREITTFGGTIIANNVVNWGHANLDNIAASRLGPIALGLYGRGCNFAYQPVNTVVNGLQSVLLSSTAKVREKKELMREVTLAVIAIVFGVLGAAYATLAAIPDTTVIGLYGDKWAGVIPLMIPFAIAMPFFGAHGLLGPILCGLGRPELEFWPQALSCVVAAVAFFTAVRFSLVALAWALLFVILVRFGLVAAFTFRLLGISWLEALSLVARRVAFSAVFGFAAWSMDRLLRVFDCGPAMRLSILVLFCLSLLVSAMWYAGNILFGRQAIRFLLKYAAHLPAPYARQLRSQAGMGDSAHLVAS